MEIDCAYCLNLENRDKHEKACPIFLRTKKAMSDWKRGYLKGREDAEMDDMSKIDRKNPTFVLGHDKGVTAIADDQEPLENL